jgi:hypothetical protein
MRKFPKDNTSSPESIQFRSPILVQNGSGDTPVSEELSGATPSPNGHVRKPGETDLDVLLSNLELGTFECQTNNFQTASENAIAQPGHSLFSLDRIVLEQIAFDIRSKLESTAVTMHELNTPSKELFDAIEIVTAKNIAAWIRLYFRHYNKHGPIVHEATFNPVRAALPLVLAIMSIGVMASLPMPSDRILLTASLVFYS